MDTQPITYTIKGWMPNGVPMDWSVPVKIEHNFFAEALEFTSRLMAQGFLLQEPGLEAGEESETIVTVMRRAKSDGTPIIDFYPAWGAGGDTPFGTFKYLHKYLNDADEIQTFLKAAGFQSLEDVPLYDGQSPLKRTSGKQHPKETSVPTPFKVVRKQGKEKLSSDGETYRQWELVRYEATLTSVPQSIQDAPRNDLAMAVGQNVPVPAKTAAERLNGNGHEKGRNLATQLPTAGEVREFQTVSVNVRLQNGQARYAINATDHTVIWAYSRDIFRQLGYPESVIEFWKDKEQRIEFSQKMPVKAEWKLRENGDGGYWSAIVEKVEASTPASEIPF